MLYFGQKKEGECIWISTKDEFDCTNKLGGLIMKKKMFIVIMSLLVSLTGCGSSKTTSSSSKEKININLWKRFHADFLYKKEAITHTGK